MGAGRKTLISLLLVGCGGLYPYEPPQPPRPDPVKGADCEAACDRGRELGCFFAQDSGGVECEDTCLTLSRWFDAECVAGIETCEQQAACAVDP